MIGKAKSISHGINDIRYISGESRNKEHPELIYHVKDNLLPCELDAQGVWDMMRANAPMAKNVISGLKSARPRDIRKTSPRMIGGSCGMTLSGSSTT